MPSFREQVERIYREQVLQINKKRAAAIAAVVATAIAAIWGINQHADRELTCADFARQKMMESQAGKTIDEMRESFDKLRSRQHGFFEECMKK